MCENVPYPGSSQDRSWMTNPVGRECPSTPGSEWTQPGQEREVGRKEKAKGKDQKGKCVRACVCVDVEGCAWTGCKDELVDKMGKEKLSMEVCACACVEVTVDLRVERWRYGVHGDACVCMCG